MNKWMQRTWEVYGEGIGYLGTVKADTSAGAKRWARRLWPDVRSFSVTRL